MEGAARGMVFRVRLENDWELYRFAQAEASPGPSKQVLYFREPELDLHGLGVVGAFSC